MKMKLFSIVLIIAILFVDVVPAYAEDENSQTVSKPILDIIREQGDADSTSAIYDSQYYIEVPSRYGDLSIFDYDLEGDVALRVYAPFPFWDMLEEPTENMIVAAEQNDEEDEIRIYAVFDENPVEIIECYGDDTLDLFDMEDVAVALEDPYKNGTPTYITDIINSSIYTSELHNASNVYTRVVCFDHTAGRMGMAVYYIGTEDTIVRYYEDYYAQPMDFVLEDFQYWGAEYYGSLNAIDEYGNVLNGGKLSFAEYIAAQNDSQSTMNDVGFWTKYGMYIIGAMAVILGGITVAGILKKRKSA